MPDLNDADLFLVERPAGADAGSYKLRKDNLAADLLNTDLMLVERLGESFKATGEDIKGSIGGTPEVTTAPTLAATPNTWPSSLTATTTTVLNAEQDTSYAPWFKNDVQIVGSSGLNYTADSSGVWKYQERWVGTDGSEVFPNAEVIIAQPEVAVPTVIAPEDGAGVGGDVTYTPMTSQINNNAPITAGGWYSTAAASNVYWSGLCYGNISIPRFVAVGPQVSMYSDNGIDWIPTTPAVDPMNGISGNWYAVAFGDNLNSGGPKYVAVGYNPYGGMMYSGNGISWALSPSNPALSFWTSVVCGNGRFVAVSYSNTQRIMYSDDGINWTLSGSTASTDLGDWQSVTFGYGNDAGSASGVFIAVANGGDNRIAFSNDGDTWSIKSPPSSAVSNYLNSVTWGAGRFVAVGLGQIMYSDNGSNWYNDGVTDIPNLNWYSVTYGNGRFVAVAQNSATTISSTDGVNWTQTEALIATWQQIAYGINKYVVTSSTQAMMWSTTGIDAFTTLAFDDANTYNNDGGADMGMLISETFKKDQTVYAASDSSITGTLVSDASSNTMELKNVTGTWGNTLRVVNNTQATDAAPDPAALEFVGSIPAAATGTISTWENATWSVTTGGVTQTQNVGITPGAQQTLNVADAPDITLVGGTAYDVTVKYAAPDCKPNTSSANTFKTSGSLLNWSESTLPSDALASQWNDVSYGATGGGSDNCFLAVGADSDKTNFMFSNDGNTWTSLSPAGPTGVKNYCVTYASTYWFGLSSNSTWFRLQNVTGSVNAGWNNNLPTNAQWMDICWGSALGRLVGVAGQGTVTGGVQTSPIIYSDDNGENWTNAAQPNTYGGGWSGVAYSTPLNKYVACSLYNSINNIRFIYSTDGINWESSSTTIPGNPSFKDVCWGNDKFVAVNSDGSGQKVAYSLDGMTWSQVGVTGIDDATATWYSITYSDTDNQFVAVADGGLNRIAISPDGITWSTGASATQTAWRSIAYGNGSYTIVGYADANYSSSGAVTLATSEYFDTNKKITATDINIIGRYGIEPNSNAAQTLGFAQLTEQPSYAVSGYELQADGKYKPLRNLLPEIARAASAWAQSTSYTIGQIILYNGNLYQVTVAHTSSSSFNVSDFELIGAEY